jgi:triacylglycerol lipase
MKTRLSKFLAAIFLAVPSCAPTPAAARPRVQRVVLVHGIFETGSAFKTLKKRLEKRGFECYVPRLKPSDGRGGLNNFASRLKQDIDTKFGTQEPINIVAFSMGGIVSRQYLQVLGGADRCENFITISSPHHGTKAAWLYPSQGATEMRPGSPFLANLRKTQDRLGKIPVASYRTPMDLIILPPTSSIWDRAENVEYPILMHPLMITSDRVITDIEQRLLK